MDERVIDVLKERPVVIPRIVFKNYKKLGISEEELIILIYIIDSGDKIIYNPELFVRDLLFDKFRAMEVINNLATKNMITIKVEKNSDGKMEEYIYVDVFYNKLFGIILDSETNALEVEDVEIFSVFEQELGRTISPMEVEKIREWINDGISKKLIIEALKEAVFKNARSLNYINSILYSWKQKGIKTVEEARNEKQKFRNSKKVVEPMFDYNWLEDD